MSTVAPFRFQERVVSRSVGFQSFRGSIPVPVGRDVSETTRTQTTTTSKSSKTAERALPRLPRKPPEKEHPALGDLEVSEQLRWNESFDIRSKHSQPSESMALKTLPVKVSCSYAPFKNEATHEERWSLAYWAALMKHNVRHSHSCADYGFWVASKTH